MKQEKSLLNRYLETTKGRQIIACSMVSPVKRSPIYKNNQAFYKINDRLLNEEQIKEYDLEQAILFRKSSMEKYVLTEDDMVLTEEKLVKIKNEEKRNVGVVGLTPDDSGAKEVKESILDLTKTKIKQLYP